MTNKRTHIVIPADLATAIDRFVGKRGRSKFFADLAGRELRRRRLLKALDEAVGCWKDENHPELKHGSVAYVRKLRKGWEKDYRRRQEDS